MTLRLNRSVVCGNVNVSLDVELSGLDEFMNSKSGFCFEFVEMLIDKVSTDSGASENPD